VFWLIKLKRFCRNLRLFTAASWRIYNERDLPTRAKALAFVTLTSILPFFVIIFSVVNIFVKPDDWKTIEAAFLDILAPGANPASLQWALDIIRSSRSAFFSGIGLVVLLWAVYAIFLNIEHAFRTVWGAEASPGSTLLRMPEYIAFILLFPLLVVGSFDVFGAILTIPALSTMLSKVILSAKVYSPLFSLPWVVLFFFILYKFILRKREQKGLFTNDLIGAAFAGTGYTVIKYIFILYINKIIHLDRVYGPLTLIVILAFWTYISWIIILLGLVVSYVYKHPACLEIRE